MTRYDFVLRDQIQETFCATKMPQGGMHNSEKALGEVYFPIGKPSTPTIEYSAGIGSQIFRKPNDDLIGQLSVMNNAMPPGTPCYQRFICSDNIRSSFETPWVE